MWELLQLIVLVALVGGIGAFLVPDVGEVKFLDAMTGRVAAESLTLKLFTSNTTPAEGDTASTYTVAAGGGYADKTLAPASWGAATTATGTTTSTYGIQTWTFTGALTASATIYGYYLVGATSTILYLAERASASFQPASNGDSYSVTPVLGLD